MFIYIKVERPNKSWLSIILFSLILMILNTNPEGEFSSSQPKRKKDAATMVCTNMILIGTLKDNMNFDVLTRSRFQFTYFLPFLLDEAPERKNRSILTTVVETDTEKDATTMAYMNMILTGTLKDNIKYDILSRNRFLIHYFVLFLLHEAQKWILEFTIF